MPFLNLRNSICALETSQPDSGYYSIIIVNGVTLVLIFDKLIEKDFFIFMFIGNSRDHK